MILLCHNICTEIYTTLGAPVLGSSEAAQHRRRWRAAQKLCVFAPKVVLRPNNHPNQQYHDRTLGPGHTLCLHSNINRKKTFAPPCFVVPSLRASPNEVQRGAKTVPVYPRNRSSTDKSPLTHISLTPNTQFGPHKAHIGPYFFGPRLSAAAHRRFAATQNLSIQLPGGPHVPAEFVISTA